MHLPTLNNNIKRHAHNSIISTKPKSHAQRSILSNPRSYRATSNPSIIHRPIYQLHPPLLLIITIQRRLLSNNLLQTSSTLLLSTIQTLPHSTSINRLPLRNPLPTSKRISFSDTTLTIHH